MQAASRLRKERMLQEVMELAGKHRTIAVANLKKVRASQLSELRKKFRGELTIKVSEHFYGGFRTGVEEALKLAEEANSVNLIGKRIVEAAVKRGLIHREAVIEVASVPHAIMVKV